ncbi:MAG: glutathione S-transferase N-terminal domain-containing protein, partial [Proteobacteria bacterium]|nr:glutathione S-transferase N-terminal domain-containing protein [Pseudomonadota bacterium]
MLKLYGSGASRWVKPYWLLKEMEVPFEACTVTLSKGEHKQPKFLELNPFAKVPALEDGDKRLFESAAICSYLADKYQEKGLIPPVGSFERAQHEQWISFTISELEQPLWRIIKDRLFYPLSNRSPADFLLANEDFAWLL